MKAMVCNKYGSPDVLKYKEIDKPVPRANEVLVKIMATSVNAADLEYLNGIFLIRLRGPLKPTHKILGSDIAGIVESIGSNVTQFQVGDEVFADLTEEGYGAFAEYKCVPEQALSLKPMELTFEQTAAVPSAAIIALQAIRYNGPIQANQQVLINGAGGGMGTFAIQLAKLWGAEVTGVDSAMKLELLRKLGADHVIDYRQENFTQNRSKYDLIVDTAAYHSVNSYKDALHPKGAYAMIGGSMKLMFKILLQAQGILKTENKKLGIVMGEPNKKSDLTFLNELLKRGKIKPVLDKVYPLKELAQAFRYVGEGKAKGKVVINME